MKNLKAMKAVFESRGESTCERTQNLMSAFIDSMATEGEVRIVEAHVSDCERCQRQLQAFVSVKNLLASAEEPEMPEDLVLMTRVRLSHVRSWDARLRLGTRLSNAIRPIAVPAAAGVTITVLFFSVLMGSLLAVPVKHSNSPIFTPTPLYQDVRTTELIVDRFTGAGRSLGEPLTIETQVDGKGRVIRYLVLSGPDGPEVDRWLKELLYFAKFRPAMMFGQPVNSRLILSFVDVS